MPQILNETLYVIYQNGKPYDVPGRKLVYCLECTAQAVITRESIKIAKRRWPQAEDHEKEADKVLKEFSVVEYRPK